MFQKNALLAEMRFKTSIPESVEKDNYHFVNFDDLWVHFAQDTGLALLLARKWCKMESGKKFYRNTL